MRALAFVGGGQKRLVVRDWALTLASVEYITRSTAAHGISMISKADGCLCLVPRVAVLTQPPRPHCTGHYIQHVVTPYARTLVVGCSCGMLPERAASGAPGRRRPYLPQLRGPFQSTLVMRYTEGNMTQDYDNTTLHRRATEHRGCGIPPECLGWQGSMDASLLDKEEER